MCITTGNNTCDAMAKLHLCGNIIPQIWHKTIVSEKTGKADLIAINILADIAYWYMIAFSSFGGNTKDSISIEVCYIINTRPYDPYGYAKPDINTQPLFYSLRDNEIYLDIGNEEKIDNAFEIVCQWMDKILIPKMNELCATE